MLARTSILLAALTPLASAQSTAPSRAPARPQASAPASSQAPQQVQARAIQSPVRNAGIYHVATGTWTRSGGQVANFGVQEIIYSNTAASGYFTSFGGAGAGAPNSQNFDEGGLPGPGNGTLTSSSGMPLRPEYNVDGFQIGYCDQGASATGGWELNFYAEYDPCTLAVNPPDGTIVLNGLPAGGCWIVTVDLAATQQEFCLTAEGNFGTWNNSVANDSFGWSYEYVGNDGSAPAGFILTGDPKYTDPNWTVGGLPTDGSNTYYGAVSGCPGTGTGYLTQDFWWLEDPTGAATNCYFFGGYINRNGCGGPQGNPHASFWMEMYGETVCGSSPNFGTIYCMSNPNSTGVNTTMEMLGSPVATSNDVILRAGSMPLNSFGFFITSQTQNPNPFTPPNSQGVVCVSGNIGRFIGPGQLKTSGSIGEITLDTNLGEWTLTAIPLSNGNYSAMAGITSNFQLWHRDQVGGASTSNFSDAITHTW